MLYYFLFPLAKYHTIFNVFQYITFRTIYAAVTALVLSLIMGPYLITRLKRMNIGEVVREDGPPTHVNKEGTPTMGGTLILLVVIFTVMLWGNLANKYVWLLTFVTVGMGLIGFIDDYKKLVRRNKKGMRPAVKFTAQVVVATAAALFIYYMNFDTEITIPFFKDVVIDLKWLYIPFAIFVIVGTSNAVNLTDGLDGLAIGPMMISAATYTLLAYLAGHLKIADYLNIMFVPMAGELAVFAGAMVGASLGFLWFNTYPAQVFMGDVGSLSLGGALGTLAVLTKQEALLLIVGGIFVVEALSVIFQVGSFKLTGKRVFAMAPIHHHYELKGWAEPKIIVRFWIISIILALVAISTLKLR
ncbi:MAG: phospho-N-acetylmuramoyl-pentapeptide-transferase [Thermodesulfobacteriota bacterium]|nr:MAG: phospho-N-acetylmuramoyl-pentapeptide-transferase [Thermodesulfobacteriota bacterium]